MLDVSARWWVTSAAREPHRLEMWLTYWSMRRRASRTPLRRVRFRDEQGLAEQNQEGRGGRREDIRDAAA
ncbi:MAG: hypothetical protein ACRDRW_06200 [Pseudonocardiaceae bacterium]